MTRKAKRQKITPRSGPGVTNPKAEAAERQNGNPKPPSQSWRVTAIERFPELNAKIADAETPYLLWFELRDAFEKAYEQVPRNESLIRRIYGFAFWCDAQERGRSAEDDLMTCASVCFYEHIPQHPAARLDMPRWFTLQHLDNAQKSFSYQIGRDEFRSLREYVKNNASMFRPDLRRTLGAIDQLEK